MSVELGVLLPTREAAITGDLDARRLIGFAGDAEAAGFASVWAGDSLLARPRLEPLTLLAAVAASTERVTVGTAALTAALRHPLLTAHAIATVDRVAAGRVVLGLGAGFPFPETEADFAAAGMPFRDRFARLMETIALWRALWSPTGASSFDGLYWQLEGLDGLPTPTRPGGPPLWLAGAGPLALRAAGRAFDGWLPYPPSPEDYRSGLSAIGASAADSHREGKPFTPALYATVTLDEDEGAARQELDQYLDAYYGFPLEVMGGLQACYAGGVDGCARWLRRYIDQGARHIVLRFGSFDSATQLRRAADGVLPRVVE